MANDVRFGVEWIGYDNVSKVAKGVQKNVDAANNSIKKGGEEMDAAAKKALHFQNKLLGVGKAFGAFSVLVAARELKQYTENAEKAARATAELKDQLGQLSKEQKENLFWIKAQERATKNANEEYGNFVSNIRAAVAQSKFENEVRAQTLDFYQRTYGVFVLWNAEARKKFELDVAANIEAAKARELMAQGLPTLEQQIDLKKQEADAEKKLQDARLAATETLAAYVQEIERMGLANDNLSEGQKLLNEQIPKLDDVLKRLKDTGQFTGDTFRYVVEQLLKLKEGAKDAVSELSKLSSSGKLGKTGIDTSHLSNEQAQKILNNNPGKYSGTNPATGNPWGGSAPNKTTTTKKQTPGG